ncbi:MAG: hypothetical protein QM617_12115, partial [Comamonas sp.]
GWQAAEGAGLAQAGGTLVVAPLFQVAAPAAARCTSPGVPAAQPGELLWTCASWQEGAPSASQPEVTAIGALDALVAHLAVQWPSLRQVTIAGFSAGAQLVQRAAGFMADPPAGIALRFVVADPGSWLSFDRDWPLADASTCPAARRWKYGIEGLPAWLGRDAATARARYARADLHYLEGARDSSDVRGTAYGALDRSCAALAQGPYRLQRGLAYAAYDRARLAPALARQVVVVPGCAHDVRCVLPHPVAREALFGTPTH